MLFRDKMGGGQQVSPIAEVLLPIHRCSERKSQSTLKMRTLIGQLHNSGWSYTQESMGSTYRLSGFI